MAKSKKGKPTAEEAAAAARRLRAVYVHERSAFETMKLGERYRYRPPRRYDGRPAVETDDGVVLEKAVKPAWLDLARHLADCGVTMLELFVEAQFHALAPTARAPEPLQLRTDACLSRYRDYVEGTEADVILELKLQTGLAADRITFLQLYGDAAKEDSYAIVLLDDDLELSPLFRYCLATSLGGSRFHRIAKRYGPEACCEYCRCRKYYKRHWKRILPVGFDRYARSVYDVILEEEGRHADPEESEDV